MFPRIAFFIVILLAPMIVDAREITLRIKITGFLSEVPLDAVVKVASRTDAAPRVVELSNESRDRNGHFSEDINTGFNTENTEFLVVYGKVVAPDGSRVGVIPNTLIRPKDLEAGFAQKSISARSDRSRAFEESYPFSQGFNIGFINGNNIEAAFKSTKLLIEEKVVIGEKWQILFNSFLQNIQFFKNNNPYIPRALTYLRNYGKASDNEEFYKFYAEALTRLDRLGVDGTEVTEDQDLGEYIFREIDDTIMNYPSSTLPVFRTIIDVLNDEKRYLECVKISATMFRSVRRNQRVVDLVKADPLAREYLLSAMQGATECYQLDYADRAEEGNKKSVKGAAEFHKSDEETDLKISEFVDLFEQIEDLFPRRPERRFDRSAASRINEISKYYRFFTDDTEVDGS